MLFFPGTAQAADPACAALSKEIDGWALAAKDGAQLEPIEAYIGAGVIPALVRRAETAAPLLAFDLYRTIGMAGHAEGLRLLRTMKRRPSSEARVGRAIGLLALGDATESATITRALTTASLEVRLRTARALSRMRALRPREMLRPALEDFESEVRLVAAESLLRVGSVKARRALVELSKSAPDGVRARAIDVLSKSRYANALEETATEEPVRASLKSSTGRKDVARRARVAIGSNAPSARSAAFAALIASKEETPASLEKLAKRPIDKLGPAVTVELAMAQALLGHTSALAVLESAENSLAPRAIAVLVDSAHVFEADAPLVEPIASSLCSLVDRWIKANALTEAEAARALDALRVVTQRAARGVVRARLSGADGVLLRAAIRALGIIGLPEDVRDLIAVAGKNHSDESRVEAYRAAYQLCAGT